MSKKSAGLFRVGVSFESSVLCMGEPVARDELKKTPSGNAWKYDGKSRHWSLCKADCKTGKLFTVLDMERGTA